MGLYMRNVDLLHVQENPLNKYRSRDLK